MELFNRTEKSQINTKDFATIYTDGACLGNPGKGGYGIVIIKNNIEKRYAAGYRLTTNNRMEILAAIIAFEKLKTPHSIELYSDSNLLVSAFNQNWLSNWQKNGWKKADKSKVINQDLWQRMITAVKPHKVKFIWVKGHANNFYNEVCDKISKEAAESDKLRIDEVYEKENS